MPDSLSPRRIALIGHAQGAEAQKTVQKFQCYVCCSASPSWFQRSNPISNPAAPAFNVQNLSQLIWLDQSGDLVRFQQAFKKDIKSEPQRLVPLSRKKDIPLSSRAPFIILLFQFVKGCTLASSVRPQWGMYAGCQATSTSEYVKVLCIMH